MHVCIFGFLAITFFELISTAVGPRITVLNSSNVTKLLHANGKKTKAKICLIHIYKDLRAQNNTVSRTKRIINVLQKNF